MLAVLAVAVLAIRRFVRKKDVLHGDYIERPPPRRED
jgi:hypothetical protein